MWFILVLLILWQFFGIGYTSPIVGGKDVGTVIKHKNEYMILGKDKYPFMAYLIFFDLDDVRPRKNIPSITSCGGVIVSKNAVLTSAHCLEDNKSVTKVYVRVGILHLDYDKKKGQARKMIKYVMHNNYVGECQVNESKDEFCLNDLAIVWVHKPFIFDPYVKKAILSTSTDDLTNKTGLIMGWGLNGNGKTSIMLQEAAMNVISIEDCKVSHHEVVITNSMLCLISKNKDAGTCGGDSGGPFVIDGVVYGIAAFNIIDEKDGKEICDTTFPSVYTNVGYYTQWINLELLKGPLVSGASSSNQFTEKKEEENLNVGTSSKFTIPKC